MNLGIIIIIVIGGLWGLGLFFGVIHGFSKTFSPAPVNMETASDQAKEQQIVDDTKEKQQQMMDDIKQKMEDQQHRY